MSTFPIFIVDAFTSVPYKGNPAGVCFIQPGHEFADDKKYLTIAAEMRHSETAFLTARQQPNHYDLRWFTPTTEVSLCGHATLASAHAIFSQTGNSQDLHFHTKSGELVVAKEADRRLRMDFPKGNPAAASLPTDTKLQLLKLLGLEAQESLVTDVQFCAKTTKLFFELNSSDLVFNATTPDPDKLMAVKFPSTMNVRGLAIVSRTIVPREGHPDLASSDIASRYFSPWNGLTEDPVNGSSHTALGVMYSRKLGKQTLKCYAASARSGVMWLDVPADSDRLYIKGYASLVLHGSLNAPQ